MDKIKEKIKSNKENIIIFGIILSICIIMCSPLLQFHIASDTYNLMDLGYFEYPTHYFLKDARLMSTAITYLAGELNLSYEFYIVFMEVFAIVISAFSIYYIYKTVSEKTSLENIWKKVLVIMGAFILIFNCMSLEYLLYAESSVMCLSVLLSVLGARIFTSEKKYKYIKSLLLIMLATFCYQGAVNIFLPLTILFLFIDNTKKDAKKVLIDIVKGFSIIAIAYLVNVISISIINIMLREEQGRIASGILNNLKNFPMLIKYIIGYTLIYNFNLWPTAITLVTIAITSLIIVFQKDANEKILKYIIIVISALGISIAPIFFMKSPSVEPRMAMSIGAIVGMSLIYLMTLEHTKKIEYCISAIIVVFFIFNIINTLQIYSAHIAGNKIDENMAMTIKYKIEEYEKETGIIVNKVAYYRDANHRDFHYGWDKKLSSFGQRAFDNYYCIVEALNYYCNRKFERTSMDKEVYDKYFAGKDWNAYSDEQIVFEGNIMYICTY